MFVFNIILFIIHELTSCFFFLTGTFSPESKIPYDPLWKGPLLKNRHCTNRFWLIAFFAFLAVWALAANYGMTLIVFY